MQCLKTNLEVVCTVGSTYTKHWFTQWQDQVAIILTLPNMKNNTTYVLSCDSIIKILDRLFQPQYMQRLFNFQWAQGVQGWVPLPFTF